MSDVSTSCRDISELTPLAQTACNLFMRECGRQGVRIFITETYRSQARQDYLYSLGRTISGNKVTWTHNSRHTQRRAWDIACSPPIDLYDDGVIRKAGNIALGLGLIWGGAWSTPDAPHIEMPKNWIEPKIEEEEIDMEQLKQLEERMARLESKMVYNYVDDNMPEWARGTVQMLVDKGVLKGNANGELGLDDSMLRILVMLDRSGVFSE